MSAPPNNSNAVKTMDLKSRFPARSPEHQKALNEYLKAHTPPPMSNQALISCAAILGLLLMVATVIYLVFFAQ